MCARARVHVFFVTRPGIVPVADFLAKDSMLPTVVDQIVFWTIAVTCWICSIVGMWLALKPAYLGLGLFLLSFAVVCVCPTNELCGCDSLLVFVCVLLNE